MKTHDRMNPRPAMRMLRRLGLWVMVAGCVTLPLSSFAAVFVSVAIAPPPLPVYVQPVMPGPGYIWVPGYWAYGDYGYFWVPGTWVLAPFVGALWTPGYWGWSGGFYVFHAGYWGPRVGFYGGINYGFGYTGRGYQGGYWNHGTFNYNRAVNNINTANVTHVYSRTVVNNTAVNRVSYNGGTGGVSARPTAQDAIAAHDPHTQALAAQTRQLDMASHNQALRASVNHGMPSIAATSRAGDFSAHSVAMARPIAGANYGTMSRPNFAAQRSASYVPRSSNGAPAPQTYRPATGHVHSSQPSGAYAGSMRPAPAYHPAPATHAYQPRPQPHAAPHRAPPPGHPRENGH